MESNDNKVSKYFQLPTLRLTELKQTLKNSDKVWMKNTYPVKQENYLFGIEVEVENIRDHGSITYWKPVADNSLRNHGIEFVSYPLRMEQVEGALNEINRALPETRSFSGRTSVHIHMNVRDLTISQIMNLTYLYLAVEKVLFKWVGHNREKNPFCIPISEAGYFMNLTKILKYPPVLRETWNKYSALNLVPMAEKGTVEFRHMYGTLDTKTLLTWINLLACLKDKAKSMTLEEIIDMITPLNSNSAYQLFIQHLFNEFAAEFEGYQLQELMERNVSLIKLSTIQKAPDETMNRTMFPPPNWTTADLIARNIRETDFTTATIRTA